MLGSTKTVCSVSAAAAAALVVAGGIAALAAVLYCGALLLRCLLPRFFGAAPLLLPALVFWGKS